MTPSGRKGRKRKKGKENTEIFLLFLPSREKNRLIFQTGQTGVYFYVEKDWKQPRYEGV